VKIDVKVRLFPDAEQQRALARTLRACNAAANAVSAIAWERRVFRAYSLQEVTYGTVRTDFGLAAQATVRVIKKVADAYRKDQKQRRSFRPDSAQPFDARCLSWQIDEARPGGTVSIWTIDGRIHGLHFKGSPEIVEVLRSCRRGESDLIHRDGMWFLSTTCDVPLPSPASPSGFLGVDLGIVNLATTSDGKTHSGKALNRRRYRNRVLRARLQTKGTRSAKRLLKKRNRKESRFALDVNHCISKKIVAEAKRTGRGIALEDLKGIRERVRHRKPQRATMHTWSFNLLGKHIAYKAARAGLPVVLVDPRYTSQTCAECGHRDRQSRKSQGAFICVSCGVVAHADHNAARNIADLGAARWAAISQPNAA
jgi:IS605 OrfB family transposase